MGSTSFVENRLEGEGTTSKVAPPALLLEEEKFSFQQDIVQAVHDHNIPKRLVFNPDQTPLLYVSPGKYTFAPKGSKHVPIKGQDDKRQITATFAVNDAGEFMPMQLIYKGKTKRSLPKHHFPDGFNVTYSENHWSNMEKSLEFFNEVIFPQIERIKQEENLPSEQVSLVLMDNFKGQDNDAVKNFSRRHDVCHAQYLITLPVGFNPLTLLLTSQLNRL